MSQNPYRIAVASIKGGTGKTTTAVSLAYALAQTGPTLLADFDPQAQVAYHFGLKQKPGIAEWLIEDRDYASCTYANVRPNLSILPGDTMTKQVGEFYGEKGGRYPLMGRIHEIRDQQFQVFDTAAGGYLQEAAIAVADVVIVPCRLEAASVLSLSHTLSVFRQIVGDEKPIILLPVGFMKGYNEHKRNLATLIERLGPKYKLSEDSAVPLRICVAEALSYGKPIFEFEEKAIIPVCNAYLRLAERVLTGAALEQETLKLEAMYGAED